MSPSTYEKTYPVPRSEQDWEEARQLSPISDLVEYFWDYARQQPGVVALWCFGVGFVLGWKLKPW